LEGRGSRPSLSENPKALLAFFVFNIIIKLMRTNNKIQVIVFNKKEDEILFLILKTIPKKDSFWQPITGGVEEGETFEEAAIREIGEEIGIKNNVKLIDIDYSFDFIHEDKEKHEKVFGVEVPSESNIIISEEHVEYKWVRGEDAINNYLKWDSNKLGFKKLIELLNSVNY
jgi:8-oxo-dGTP pyrophosphatase MutT (NUDIX family)